MPDIKNVTMSGKTIYVRMTLPREVSDMHVCVVPISIVHACTAVACSIYCLRSGLLKLGVALHAPTAQHVFLAAKMR